MPGKPIWEVLEANDMADLPSWEIDQEVALDPTDDENEWVARA